MLHENMGTFQADKMTKPAEELLTGDVLETNQVVLEVDQHAKMVTLHLEAPDGDIRRVRRNRKTRITRVGWYDGI